MSSVSYRPLASEAGMHLKSTESAASDSTLGYDKRSSTQSLSLRRRRARPLSRISNLPNTQALGTHMPGTCFKKDDRTSFQKPTTIDSSYFTGFDSQQLSESSAAGLGVADDLEATLSVAIELLKNERHRTCELASELHATRNDFEHERRRRGEIATQLRKLTAVVEEMIGFEWQPHKSADDMHKQNRPLSDFIGVRLDLFQKLYLTCIEGIRGDLADTEAANAAYMASVARRLRQNVGSTFSSTKDSSNSKGRWSQPPADNSAQIFSNGAAKLSENYFSQLADERFLLSREFSDQALTNNDQEIKESQRRVSSSLQNMQLDSDAELSVCDEGDGLFCIIPGSLKARSSVISRPLSTAQANRHSAIIGDNLVSLSVAFSEENDNLEMPAMLTAEASSSTIPCSQEPLTPASDDSMQESGPAAAKAVDLTMPFIVTSARPSEDAPTMSCRVGRTFDNPLGSGYISHKIAPNKTLIGRSSVAAYQKK